MDHTRIKRKLKKHNTINIYENGGKTKGIVTLRNVKVKEIYEGRIICDVDIVYVGTVDIFGYVMGPRGRVDNGDGAFKRWFSTIQRNKRLRKVLDTPIQNYMKYFGIQFKWYGDFNIKKITWNDFCIPPTS